MSVQPLCRYLAEDPQQLATSASRKSTLYLVAARVSQVAIVLLTASVCAVGLGLLTVPPFWLALIAIGGVIALTPLASKCQTLSREHKNIAEIQQKVADAVLEVKSWSGEQLKDFFTDNQISSPPQDVDLTRLIGRFVAYGKIIEEQGEEIEQNNGVQHDPKNPTLEHAHKAKAWSILEETVLPLKLESAVLLQSMIEPTRNIELSDDFDIIQKSFDLRNMDAVLGRKWVYIQQKDANKPLTIQTVDRKKIPELQRLLFTLNSIPEETEVLDQE